MRTSTCLLWLAIPVVAPAAPDAKPDASAVVATVESTLGTSGKQIRQYAFDGDPMTFFASATNPVASDHFTLALDRPVPVRSIVVFAGPPDGGERPGQGSLEVSGDGLVFEEVAKFREGMARAEPKDRPIRSIRIKPGPDLSHPLVIREIVIDSADPVPTFANPVEYSVDVADAPEMKEWADKAARLCERWYPRINQELRSGHNPPTQVSITLKANYKGVAQASGNRITGSVKFFKDHPDDVGAMIHESCHVVQGYRSRGNPGWLVEGVADYVRFFVFEPGKAGPVNPNRAHYNGSYRTTAAFLAFVSEKYDKELVLKLNKLMREGNYKEAAFREMTGKTAQELDEEWLASLRK